MPAREHRSLPTVSDIKRVGGRVRLVGWSRSVPMLAALLENKLIATLFSRSPRRFPTASNQYPGSFAEQRKEYMDGLGSSTRVLSVVTPHCLPFYHARRVAHSDCGLGLRAVDRGLYVCQSCAEPLFEPGGRVDAVYVVVFVGLRSGIKLNRIWEVEFARISLIFVGKIQTLSNFSHVMHPLFFERGLYYNPYHTQVFQKPSITRSHLMSPLILSPT